MTERTPVSPSRESSTVPSNHWLCAKCGCTVYAGLTHHCSTAPMIATSSPYDLQGDKEYPGE